MTSQVTEAALPKLGMATRRWWKVELDKRSNAKPIKVTLMAPILGAQNFYEEVGYERTVANPAAIGEAAQVVLDRVGSYAVHVGDYQKQVR